MSLSYYLEEEKKQYGDATKSNFLIIFHNVCYAAPLFNLRMVYFLLIIWVINHQTHS